MAIMLGATDATMTPPKSSASQPLSRAAAAFGVASPPPALLVPRVISRGRVTRHSSADAYDQVVGSDGEQEEEQDEVEEVAPLESQPSGLAGAAHVAFAICKRRDNLEAAREELEIEYGDDATVEVEYFKLDELEKAYKMQWRSSDGAESAEKKKPRRK